MPGTVYDAYEELTAYQNGAVSLPRYAKIGGFDECAFFGVVYPGQPAAACSSLWTEWERMSLATALAEAQQEIEQVVGYPLSPTWVSGSVHTQADADERWVDEQPYRIRQVTRYGHVIEPGIRAVESVAESLALDHSADPATVGPVATTAEHANEIKVYYPGSNREIVASRVIIANGEATIEIPRCRLVAPDRLNNPDGGWDYEDLGNFLDTVDIRREYTDPAVQAELVRPGCRNERCAGGCGECTHEACIYVRDARAGIVDVRPATFDEVADEWKPAHPCRQYARVRLHYRCGLQRLSLQAERAVIRLAHAKTPESPCPRCPRTEHLWRRDRHIPDLLTRERLNCPLGIEQGAYQAWVFAKQLRLLRMGVA